MTENVNDQPTKEELSDLQENLSGRVAHSDRLLREGLDEALREAERHRKEFGAAYRNVLIALERTSEGARSELVPVFQALGRFAAT